MKTLNTSMLKKLFFIKNDDKIYDEKKSFLICSNWFKNKVIKTKKINDTKTVYRKNQSNSRIYEE